MLAPDERELLVDALRPPPGASLEFCVGTTYSLDLQALLFAPLTFALLDWRDDIAGDGRPDPIALLESLRRYASKTAIFCQAGQIYVPSQNERLLSFLERSVHAVEPPRNDGVFHPKVWVLRFRLADGSSSYRTLCLSRNLTFDRSWDTMLRLDGTLGTGSTGEPLSRFVRSLPDLAVGKVPAELRSKIDDLANELQHVDFAPPPGFHSVRFWPLGLTSEDIWPFAGRRDDVLVVSPFVTRTFLSRFATGTARRQLVSRAESLDREVIADYELNVLSTAALDQNEPTATSTELLAQRPGVELDGLHAKLYVADAGRDARIWTGSTNATSAAFGGNVEFMVELGGKKGACGVEAVLGGGGVSFSSMLETYSRPAKLAEPSRQEHLEVRLEKAARELAARAWHTSVSEGPKPDEYRMVLTAKSFACRDETVTQARIAPITSRGAQRDLPLRKAIEVEFVPLSFAGICAFFAIELSAADGKLTAQTRFVVAAELEGAPSDRDDRLLASLLTNRAEVMRYLLLLLADGTADASAFLGNAASSTAGRLEAGEWDSFPLLEPMVRALALDPSKLRPVASLLEQLRRTPEGQELLPDGLDLIWAAISGVLEESHK